MTKATLSSWRRSFSPGGSRREPCFRLLGLPRCSCVLSLTAYWLRRDCAGPEVTVRVEYASAYGACGGRVQPGATAARCSARGPRREQVCSRPLGLGCRPCHSRPHRLHCRPTSPLRGRQQGLPTEGALCIPASYQRLTTQHLRLGV